MKGVIVMAAMVLAGCATTPPESMAAGARCDATVVQDAVGRRADAAVADVQKRSGAAIVRRYVTGDVVTMELRPDRLNVETDATGRIVKLSCG